MSVLGLGSGVCGLWSRDNSVSTSPLIASPQEMEDVQHLAERRSRPFHERC